MHSKASSLSRVCWRISGDVSARVYENQTWERHVNNENMTNFQQGFGLNNAVLFDNFHFTNLRMSKLGECRVTESRRKVSWTNHGWEQSHDREFQRGLCVGRGNENHSFVILHNEYRIAKLDPNSSTNKIVAHKRASCNVSWDAFLENAMARVYIKLSCICPCSPLEHSPRKSHLILGHHLRSLSSQKKHSGTSNIQNEGK